MRYLHMVTLTMHDAEFEISGKVTSSTMEKEHSGFVRTDKELVFYRPEANLTDREWLKDMLVQVIEQL